MPSRADACRVVEWLLRAALVGVLALAWWRSLHAAGEARVDRRAGTRALRGVLVEASQSTHVRSVEVTADSTIGAPERAWLAALRYAGVATRWHGDVPALAVQVERSAEPDARPRAIVSAGVNALASLSDSAGVLDTVRVTPRGATLSSSVMVSPVRAALGRFAARAMVPDAVPPRAVLVLGRASWEVRFTAAALQEAGWTVRTRQPAAPGVVVADAGVLPVDTARYAVVVALDSTAADLAPTLARFAVQGGGLVLAGDTPALPALSALAPARTGAREPGRVVLDADSIMRDDLPLRALASLRADAVRVESRRGTPVVAVRRAGVGRIATIAFDESWRWRMLGGTSGPAAHRAWWSRVVGLVAPAPSSVADGGEAAPRAALVAALGPSSPAIAGATAAQQTAGLPLWLLLLALALVLAETGSRRFRGAR